VAKKQAPRDIAALGFVRELVDVSRWAGRRPDLVQAGGGNTSVKSADGKTMYLKASGYGLSDLLPPGVPGGPRGYVGMSLPGVLSLLDSEDLERGAGAEAGLRDAFTACCTYRPAPEVRPSVEALLHALVGRVAVHSHPPAVVALVSSRDTRDAVARFARALGEDVLFLRYRDPGLERARDLRDALARAHTRGERPRVLLMENHGLFVWGESVAQAKRLTSRCLLVAKRLVRGGRRPAGARQPDAGAAVVGLARREALRLLPLVRGALWRATGSRFLVRFETSAEFSALVGTEPGRRALVAGPLSPDEVVYCQSQPLVLATEALSGDDEALRGRLTRAFAGYVRRHGVAPRVVLVGESGYLVLGESERSLSWTSETARATFQAKLASLALGGPRPMSRRGAAFIEHWEAEAYRRGLAGRGGGGLALATRIAVVTGAGSGLGRGIALGLARAGASVVLADIDAKAALAARAEILCETPQASVLALRADVTRERAVARLFEEAVLAFGGVDILVNAAGIAPSHPLVDFPLAEWERALRLNLTGYFLVAREAARWMLRQGCGGNIINLSSKTGLEASVDNSAYNATKAGEIHLARGWALELAPFGIRVNALAPGNVFAGSKIWNRKYIEACARKRGIRPEDVIPYYVNLTALKTEIKPQDVADAVVFLVSDRARVITGQTLVPDAGQVFVR
jgi:NAD(P)-dependent dehydrogenase (short-subunit alcohol dehydrogenase family)/rhamnose utilization protein RhaD (predicted bifunctional aldolase and dehydrogenase)